MKTNFISFLILFSFFILFSCSKNKTQSADIQINIPSSSSQKRSIITSKSTPIYHYSSYKKVNIAVKITDSNNNIIYKGDLLEGNNLIPNIPLGSYTIKSGYLAIGIPIEFDFTTYCSNKNSSNNNNTTNYYNYYSGSDALYAQNETSLNVTESGASVTLNYPKLTLLTDHHFAMRVIDSNGNRVSNAVFNYKDPISESTLNDPCTGLAFDDKSDHEGRAAIDLPSLGTNGRFIISITDSNKNSNQYIMDFSALNNDQSTFYEFTMGTEAKVRTMTDSESFLDDGISIYTKRSNGLNPRFFSITMNNNSLNLSINPNNQANNTNTFWIGYNGNTVCDNNASYCLNKNQNNRTMCRLVQYSGFNSNCNLTGAANMNNNALASYLYPSTSNSFALCPDWVSNILVSPYNFSNNFVYGYFYQYQFYWIDQEGYFSAISASGTTINSNNFYLPTVNAGSSSCYNYF